MWSLAAVLVLASSAYGIFDPCTLKLETGPCRGLIPRYGYDTEKGKCVQFMYGGCKGNKNNFLTMENCEKECKGKGAMNGLLKKGSKLDKMSKEAEPLGTLPKPLLGAFNKTSSTSKKIAEVKKSIAKKILAKEVKKAFAEAKTEDEKKSLKKAIEKNVAKAIKKAITDEKKKRQMSPIASEAENSDKMKKLKEVIVAKKVEQAFKKLKEENSNPCTLPISPGKCLAAKKRYAFDARKGKCVEFLYGGCGGNKNNFETMSECVKKCKANIPTILPA